MRLISTLALATLSVTGVVQAQQYPPMSAYLMARDAELALARSAAPVAVTEHATFKVLTPTGYQVAQEGQNGFTCLVLRGWSAPTYTPAPFRDLVYDPRVRAPICYNPVASWTVLPYQELRTKLAMTGKTPAEIAEGVSAAYIRGDLPAVTETGLAYMWSADQFLAPGIGAFHPHVMVFIPYNDNAKVGGNPFGGMAPFLSDDTGTPFAVTVIPVDPTLAIRVRP